MSNPRYHRQRRARGFTLTELMVSLVMGLIVALAAVGLARTATTTFHEQARSSQTEMAVRTAAERLKLDLMRTSYMSTGNIALDPKVSRLANAASAADVARYGGFMNTLRGIAVDPAMATIGGVPALLTSNGLTPDAIDLVGNFTTDDFYSGYIASGNGGISPGSGCTTTQAITLDMNADAAVYNLAGGTSTAPGTSTQLVTNAQAAFLPVAAQPMLAQVTDAMGCTNYVPVCTVDKNAAGQLVILINSPSGGRGVLYSNGGGYEAGNGGLLHGCGSSENGKVSIAPLQHVKWYLKASLPTLATDTTLGYAAGDKYDLVRQVYDFSNTAVGNAEIIAEYAVDLKFGIVYDLATGTASGRQKLDDLDTDNGGGDIATTTGYASTASQNSGSPGPQRVRSVKFRIAVRTSVADRDTDLPSGVTPYLTRFCVPLASSGCQYARVRTVVSEVGLTNQLRMTY